MYSTEHLPALLRRLRLSGVLQSLEARVNQANEEPVSQTEFLWRILQDELDRRESKQLQDRIRKGSVDAHKSFDGFDFRFCKNVPKQAILELGSLGFIARAENVLLLGPTGVGKSHIAQALAHKACLARHKVLFVSATDVFRQLRAARADGSYDRVLGKLVTIDLLILDDLGLRPLDQEEAGDLYEIIRLRHERKPLVVSSNRSVEELALLFKDPLLASAAIDRLLHKAHHIVIEGDSFRTSKRPLKPAAAR
jgi:DNA replication protein DnaC